MLMLSLRRGLDVPLLSFHRLLPISLNPQVWILTGFEAEIKEINAKVIILKELQKQVHEILVKLDMNGLGKGLYHLSLESDEGKLTGKIIIE